MTVGELKEILDKYDENMIIIIKKYELDDLDDYDGRCSANPIDSDLSEDDIY